MKKQMLLQVMALVLALALLASAQGPLEWIEYSGNPVFGQLIGDPKAYYPSVLYDATEFSGHGLAVKYKMWYGTSSGMVGFAYSEDGIAWADLGSVTGNVRYHCKVLYDHEGFGGDACFYKMWFADPSIWPYNTETIKYAESTDGINWVNIQPISQDPLYPLVTGYCGWWYGTYGPGTVLYNPGGYDTWNDEDPMGHKYVMYYDVATMNCIPGEIESTALAYSLDGIYWKRYEDQPVMLSGPDGAWDSLYVYAWTILNDDDGYHMWYSGGGSASHEGIGYATSSDGIDWTRDADNPIFNVNDGIDWRNTRTYTPFVIKDGFSYKMWFTGKDITGNYYSIGYATVTVTIVEVDIDIKPQRCPNRLNVRREKRLKVAILGTQDFDVNDIDVTTIELQGVAPKRWRIRDVSTPVADPEDVCDCTSDGRDGFNDLKLEFKTREIVEALGDVEDGDEVVLTLTANLNDGTPIEGYDCVIIINRRHSGKPIVSDVNEVSFPKSYQLSQNYPNPFNPITTIKYGLPKESKVTLKVFDILSQEVATLVDEHQSAGYHQINWNAADHSSGIYFYQIQAGEFQKVRKMVLLK
ncbi:T9SS type A sorting domain-containing protein [candidate division KSB1 bacterium]|nr:T9SS type A sorting domain-containing protein [candidate division KSB1 bacterium]